MAVEFIDKYVGKSAVHTTPPGPLEVIGIVNLTTLKKLRKGPRLPGTGDLRGNWKDE